MSWLDKLFRRDTKPWVPPRFSHREATPTAWTHTPKQDMLAENAGLKKRVRELERQWMT